MKFHHVLRINVLLCSLLFSSFALSQPTSTISDTDISSAVKNNISSDAALSGVNIEVMTTNGVVNLTGNLDSNTQASEAVQVAESTPGVKDVDASKLTVSGSNQPLSDALITSKVKGMFIQQKLFGDQDISATTIKVETNNGVVSLSGTADNQDQVTNATKIAKSVSGVKDVKSTINVSTTTQQ